MFSIVMPLDSNRLEQFVETKRAYDAMSQVKEFIILTRFYEDVSEFLKQSDLMRDVRLIPYGVKEGFNCSKALNLGVRNAKYDSIIITCPEVKPTSPVLEQLSGLMGQNVVCQVFDTSASGDITTSLVNTGFRQETPGMYFLAMFNKSDIEKINGWDEEFLKGYAWEDTDFGARWKRADIPFIVRDDITAIHQYHPRGESIPGSMQTNYDLFHKNNSDGVIKPINGLVKLA